MNDNEIVFCFCSHWQKLAYVYIFSTMSRKKQPQTVKQIIFEPVLSCCNKKCYEKIHRNVQEDLFSSYSACLTKIQQDHILSLGMFGEIPKSSIRTEGKYKTRELNWRYRVRIPEETVVCKKFFMGLYQVSKKRLEYLQDKLKRNKPITENRGKHCNRPRNIPESRWKLAREHLQTIPSRKSHYAYKKTNRRYFENAGLNCVKLYKLFCKFYKKKTKEKTKPMSLVSYRRFFRTQGYSFHRPRTDVCDFCTIMNHKVKTYPRNRTFQVKLSLHERQVEKYKELKKKILKDHAGDESTLVLEFDFAQNLPIPRLNVTSQFYKRLGWLYIFNIHNHTNQTSALYYYTEKEGKKNSNAVSSMLYDYIGRYMEDSVRRIILFSDACGGQNKNYTIVMFLSWLAKSLNVHISHYFPVRGHSYNVCDRNFGCYRRKMKNIEIIETVPEYIKILQEARKKPTPFETIHFTDFRTWNTALQTLCHPVPKTKSAYFKIQKYRVMTYTTTGVTNASATFFPLFTPFSIIKAGNEQPQLENEPEPSLSNKKIADLESLMKYLSRKGRKWFNDNIFT